MEIIEDVIEECKEKTRKPKPEHFAGVNKQKT